MILLSVGYLALLLVLALVLDLRRAYLATSPLPILTFVLPMFQLFAGAMSLVALLVGIPVLIQAKRGKGETGKVWIALTLSTLPLILLILVKGLDVLM